MHFKAPAALVVLASFAIGLPASALPVPLAEGDLLLEIEAHFHAARKWFGMVVDLGWDRSEGGSLTPRVEGMRSRFVLPKDPAGQRLGARLPGVASGPLEVWLDGASSLSVRTEEVGVAAVPAELVRGMVVYRNAVAGGDLLYKVTPTHVDEYLYLRTPPSVLHREFEFDVGPGVARLREAGRLIEVVGKDGAAHLRLSAPVARAADGTRRTGTVHLEGQRLIEELDLRGLPAPVLVDPDWTTTGTMTVAHWADFSWRRSDNTVMAVAGCALASCPLGLASSACNQVLASNDVWDPSSGTWNAGPALQTARYSFAAVPLASGELLVAGGCTASACAATTDTAERWSNARGEWIAAGTLPHALANATGAALASGDVLVPGGCSESECFADVARFKPGSNSWSAARPLAGPRGYHTTTALADGSVLVAGGCADVACAAVLTDAEVYDPKSDTWRSAGTMSTPRAGHTATLLDDGSVLIAGGCSTQPCRGTTLSGSEIWQADARLGGRFAGGPAMTAPRHHHTANRLQNGEILLAGGTDGADATQSFSDIYMPVSHRFLRTPRMLMSRAYHTGVLLVDGQVLIAGGCNPATCLPWAEVFSPAGLPVEVPDGGIVDAGSEGDLAEPMPDFGAPLVVSGGPHPRLFRTGAVSCSTDDTQDLPCPLAGWPAQDGDYQPNTRPMIPQNGSEVRDSVTGLVWQASDDETTYTQAQAVTRCAELATATAPAGSWRLPQVIELMTMNHYGAIGPSVDQAFAAGTQQTNYWTATAVAGSKLLGWTVKFDAGEVVPLLKDTPLPIRCVREPLKAKRAEGDHLRLAGPLSSTASTVRDESNGLEWMKQDDGVKRSWRRSLDYCARLDLDGHHDWHLPNIYELVSLVEFGSDGPVKIDPAFEAPKGDIYWSGTFNEGIPTLSWSVTFNLGVVDGVTFSGGGYARCVRHLATPTGTTCGCRLGAAPAPGATAPVAAALMLLVVLAVRRRRN